MLRAIILALVVLVALGAIVPVATEHTEASARQMERRSEKKSRAVKFRYRTRFRQARYSESARFKTTAKLRVPKAAPAKLRKKKPKKAKRSTVARRTKRKFRKSPKARVKRSSKARIRKTSARTVRKKRYRKVRRYANKPTYKKRSKVKRSRSAKKSNVKASRVRKKRVRKYSAKWWRNYRAKQSRQQAIAKRKEQMRIRRAEIEKRKMAEKAAKEASALETFASQQGESVIEGSLIDSNFDGIVSLELVGPVVGETVANGRRRTLGGVSTTVLRRSVIDEMLRENGWVENDYHKDVAGTKVYVVVAKAPDKQNNVQARTYYFAESNGRIYRVSSKVPENSSDEAVEQSEQMIRSLRTETRTQQAVKD